MRLHALYLTGALIAAAIPLSAGAQPVQANRQTAASTDQTTPTSEVCRPGWVWEPAGYVTLGRWQPARCVPRHMLEGGEGAY
jgi:hypothetical protein